MYCPLWYVPAFSGYLTELDVNLLQAVINKTFVLGPWGYLPNSWFAFSY